MDETRCHYPRSNSLKDSIQATLDGIVANKSKAAKFYLDTLEEQDHPNLYGEDHHQGLARTHRLSDGSVYFFLTHSKLTRNKKGELMQFRYGGPLEESHIVQTNPLTVAPLEQLLELNERHPSDVVFLQKLTMKMQDIFLSPTNMTNAGWPRTNGSPAPNLTILGRFSRDSPTTARPSCFSTW
jgi:hypothetical protein